MNHAVERVLQLGLIVAAGLAGSTLVLSEDHTWSQVATPSRRLVVFAVVKLVGQLVGAWAALRCRRAFSRKDRMRRAWGLMAGGFGGLFLGQLSLAYYQVVAGVATPFPSVADLFFVPGVCAMVLALGNFALAQAKSGLAMATPAQLRRAVVAGLAVALLLSLGTLVPIVVADRPWLERLLNLVYPALDLVMVVPVFALLRLSWALRGGTVFSVWALILAGAAALTVGDVAYAYFTTKGLTWLDPVLDLGLATGYLCLAWGVTKQAGVLVGD